MSMDYIAEVLKFRFGVEPDFVKFPGWSWRQPIKVDKPCSKCGSNSNVWCLHADSGGIDYYDEYYHICLDCGHTDHKTEYYSGPYHGSAPIPECPYCGREW